MEKDTEDQIKSVLNELDKLEKNEPFFSLHTIAEDEEFLYLKANQEGLILFGSTLLKTAINDPEIPVNDKGQYLIDRKFFGLDFYSEYSIHYIEKFNESATELTKKPEKQTWKDRMLAMGIKVIFFTVIILVIIGFVTVFKWLIL